MILFWLMNPINDISTRKDPLILFKSAAILTANASINNNPDPKSIAIQEQLHPEISPLKLRHSADQVFAAAKTLATNRGWQIHLSEDSQGRIEGTATTALLGFKDDWVVLVEATSAAEEGPATEKRPLSARQSASNEEQIGTGAGTEKSQRMDLAHTCTVQMRSRSRLGKSDLGANAKRIKKFFEDLAALLGPKSS